MTTQSKTFNPKTKDRPHYRMYSDTIKADFKKGLISVPGLIYYLVKAKGKDGCKFRIENVSDFCKEFEISRSAFYKAKAKLIAENFIREDIIGAVDLWVDPHGKVIEFPEESSGQVYTKVDSLPPEPDQGVSLKVDSVCKKVDSQCTERDSGDKKIHTDTPQTQTGQDFQNPSIISQSITILSQSHPPHPERERAIADEELIEFISKQGEIKAIAKNSRAYARKCLINDRDHWEKRYRDQLREQETRKQAQEQEKAIASQETLGSDQISAAAAPPVFEQRTVEDTRACKLTRIKAGWLTPKLRPSLMVHIRRWGFAIGEDGQPYDPTPDAPVPDLSQPEPVFNNAFEKRLYELQTRWDRADEDLREAIAADVELHPEWGIKIGTHGPEEVEF